MSYIVSHLWFLDCREYYEEEDVYDYDPAIPGEYHDRSNTFVPLDKPPLFGADFIKPDNDPEKMYFEDKAHYGNIGTSVLAWFAVLDEAITCGAKLAVMSKKRKKAEGTKKKNKKRRTTRGASAHVDHDESDVDNVEGKKVWLTGRTLALDVGRRYRALVFAQMEENAQEWSSTTARAWLNLCVVLSEVGIGTPHDWNGVLNLGTALRREDDGTQAATQLLPRAMKI